VKKLAHCDYLYIDNFSVLFLVSFRGVLGVLGNLNKPKMAAVSGNHVCTSGALHRFLGCIVSERVQRTGVC